MTLLCGQLCTLNHMLRTISYTPDKDFNTETYKRDNSTGKWAPSEDFFSVEISQISGPTTLRAAPIIVKAVNDPPTLEMVSMSRATPELKERWADIYMCGGSVPCECPEKALACIKLTDPDACEAKQRNQKDCWDDSTTDGNMRLTVKTTKADVYFFDSEDLGCAIGTDLKAEEGKGLCTGTPQQRQSLFTAEKQRVAMPGASIGATMHNIEVGGVCFFWACMRAFLQLFISISWK